MNYKKYEQKKVPCNQKCYKEPCNKKCYDDSEVSFYEVKKHDNSKKCKCEIEKTEDLIDAIEYKNEKIASDIAVAQNNLQQVNPDLKDIVALVHQLAKNLSEIANRLGESQSVLSLVTHKLAEVAPNQAAATKAVNDVVAKQGELNELIACLDEAFNKTVCCLKKEDCGFPVLIPIEKNKCGCHKDWDCECEKDWDCGCKH